MKFYLSLVYLLVPIYLAASRLIAAEELQTQRLRKSPMQNESFIISEPLKNRITIIGAITSATLKSFKESVEEYPQIKEVVVDTHGGDLDSAIDIATIMKERKMNIVVEGRCFSSCGSYLFPVAEKKTVLKNSLVGTHEIRFSFKDDGKEKSVTGAEIEAEIIKHSKPDTLEIAHKSRIKITNFHKLIGIQPIHYNSYVKYISSRKRYLGTENINEIEGNTSCPRFFGWMLNQQQLESSGITGIESFWFPKNEQETNTLYQTHRMIPNSLYQGDTATLLSYCQEEPVGWFTRFWNSFRSKRVS